MNNSLRLQDLAAEEEQLYSQLPSSDPSADDIVHRRYSKIVDAYLESASSGDLEAVNRVIFLWWYSAIEPGYLTGVAEFSTRQNDEATSLLRHAVVSGLDAEFQYMLAWYYAVTDWFFEQKVPDLNQTLSQLSTATRSRNGVVDLRKVDTDRSRGQLTYYFRSMNVAQSSAAKSS